MADMTTVIDLLHKAVGTQAAVNTAAREAAAEAAKAKEATAAPPQKPATGAKGG